MMGKCEDLEMKSRAVRAIVFLAMMISESSDNNDER